MDSGIGLFLYRKICDQISSPPQSKIEYSLTGSKINIPERQLGANNLTGLMCALLVSWGMTTLVIIAGWFVFLAYDGDNLISLWRNAKPGYLIIFGSICFFLGVGLYQASFYLLKLLVSIRTTLDAIEL